VLQVDARTITSDPGSKLIGSVMGGGWQHYGSESAEGSRSLTGECRDLPPGTRAARGASSDRSHVRRLIRETVSLVQRQRTRPRARSQSARRASRWRG